MNFGNSLLICGSVLHKKAKLNTSNDTGWILCLLDATYVALPEPVTTTDLLKRIKMRCVTHYWNISKHLKDRFVSFMFVSRWRPIHFIFHA